MLSLKDIAFRGAERSGFACHWCDIGLEATASHAYHCPQLQLFWDYVGMFSTPITPDKLVLIDLPYQGKNMSPPILWGEMNAVSQNGKLDKAKAGESCYIDAIIIRI